MIIGQTLRSRSRGNAALEMALIAPVVALLLTGATDFSRFMYSAIQATGAARAGVQYGAQTSSTDYAGMAAAATNAAPNIVGLSVTARKVCTCTTVSAPISCSSACAGAGAMKAYVSVVAQKSFQPILKYPGVPSTVVIQQTAWMRVQ